MKKGGYMSQSDESVRADDKRIDELAVELAEAMRLADELKSTQKEQELMRRLASEGTHDLEAAMLIAKARLAKDEKADLIGVVEQLKKEKQYLFGEKMPESVAVRTSPAKEQRNTGGVLERAAKRAAGTGSRSDLQEYMRKRRSTL
jgi:hypothetical protein